MADPKRPIASQPQLGREQSLALARVAARRGRRRADGSAVTPPKKPE